MLTRLHVINYALIDEMEIEFEPGLNIVTGETGAGKSILVGALGLVLGMRASPEVIRTGADRCVVDAIFDLYPNHPCLKLLEEAGISAADGELILRREVLSRGRSRCYANGLAITARALQQVGQALVDLHGQHDHQSLLDVDQHLNFLDGFGKLGKLRQRVSERYHTLIDLRDQQSRKETEIQQNRDRRELLKFQVEEISTLELVAGEDEELVKEQSILENAEKLIEIAIQLEDLLYEKDDSIADRLGRAVQQLNEAQQMDPALKSQSEEMDALRFGAEELSRFFGDYGRQIEHNPERLEVVTDRLEVIEGVKKKYGGSLQTVLEYGTQATAELGLADDLDSAFDDIRAEHDLVLTEFSELCKELSGSRRKASGRLSSEICRSLRELGMPDVTFEVSLDQRQDPDGLVSQDDALYWANERGMERGEFHLSTNPGESVRPLAKVASGGEISRIMLAMKTVLAKTDSVQVLIFDEIDIGISGRIAEVVGKRLKVLSDSYQTVSITHLPQIAKMADRHFSVRKESGGGRTVTRVVALNEGERADELAKMMGGEEISALTLEHAREMLAER